VVVAGGALAQRGLLSLPLVLIACTAGSAAIDQALFLAGRFGRDWRLVAKARAHPGFVRALGFIERHPAGFVLTFRFLYGLRAVSPVAVGLSRMNAWRFTGLNLLAAALWAGLFTGLGYLFGKELEAVFARLHPPIWVMVAGAAAVLALIGLVAWRWRRPR
jgi:membrane protein DedA with SNARE-associated domain